MTMMEDLDRIASILCDRTSYMEWTSTDSTTVADTVIMFNADAEELPERFVVLYPGPNWTRENQAVNTNLFTGVTDYVLHFECFVNKSDSTRVVLREIVEYVMAIMAELEEEPVFIYKWSMEKEDPSRAEHTAQYDSVRCAILIEMIEQ